MPLVLFREIIDSTFRNIPNAGFYTYFLSILALLAFTLPYIIGGFRDARRPLARVILMYITGSLAFSTYFVIFRSFESFRLPQQTMMQITVSFIFVLFFISSFLKGRLELRKTPFNLPILLITLLSLFSFALSPNFFISLKEFTQYIFVILNFYLIIHCLDAKKHFNALVIMFLIVMTLEAVLGVFQHYGINSIIGLGSNRDPFSTLGNKNYVAEMLAMTIPLALGFSIAAKRWWAKVLCWLGITPMLFVVLISVTRGSWVGLIASLLAFFLFSIDGLSKKKAFEAVAHLGGLIVIALILMAMSSRGILFKAPDYSYISRFSSILDILGGELSKSPKYIILYTVGCVMSLAAVFFMLRRPKAKQIGVAFVAAILISISVIMMQNSKSQAALASQEAARAKTAQAQLAPPSRVEDSIVSRRFIWGGAREMIKEYPLGVGLGAFKIRYLTMLKVYLADSKLTTIPGFFKDVNAKEAHNEYLHAWAELGPLGPLFILFFIIVTIRFFYKVYYRLGDDDFTKSVLLGAFCGLVSIGSSASLGFPFHIIGTSMFCGVLLALMVFSEDRSLGADTLPLNLPGFKTIWVGAAAQIQAPEPKQKQKKKKTNEAAATQTPPDDSWKKRWVVLNFPPVEDAFGGAFVGIFVIAIALVFCVIVSFWSYNVQMANIRMKNANYIAEKANSVPPDSEDAKQIYAEARSVYDEALKLDPYNGDIHLFRGMFFQKLRVNDEALKEFLEARRYFDLPQISLDLGALYFEMGEPFYDKAAKAFYESLAIYPNYPLPRYNIGLIFYQQAMKLLENGAAGSDSVMASRDGKIQVQSSNKQKAFVLLSKAADMFLEAIKINPALDTASFKLALTYERMNDLDKAIYWYQYTIRVNPAHNDAIYNYGLVLTRKAADLASKGDQAMKAGRKQEAQRYYGEANQLQKSSSDFFRKSVTSDPNNVKGMNNLGNMYFNEGKIQQALDMYKSALKADPNYLNALMNISLAYIQLKQYENAMIYLNELIRKPLEPQHEIKTLYMVATCYSAMGRNNEAESVLSTVISKYETTQLSTSPEFISAVLRYSQVLDATGKSTIAVAKLERLLQIPMAAFQEAEALYRLGYSAGRIGQYAKSKTAFERVASRFPQSPFAAESRKNLDILRNSGR
ncbi:MAG: tetratricopeptide repeat protein [bacterium]